MESGQRLILTLSYWETPDIFDARICGSVTIIEPREVAELYRGHEVAAHTLTHPFLPELDDEEIIRQIEEDRKNLEKLLGKDIVGLAYPGGGIGGVNTNEHIISLIRKNSKIKYARTTICNGSFDTQDNLLEFHPTAYHLNFDEIMELGEKFIKLKTEEKKIFYVWGHSWITMTVGQI